MYYSIPILIMENKINVSETINSFQKLYSKIEILINQLNKCENIIININLKEKNNKTNDLYIQNFQKKKVFEIINENIKLNVKYLLGIQKEENKYLLKYNNRMTQKLSEKIDKKYPNDIIDYFFDYGLDFLYDLIYQKKENLVKNNQNIGKDNKNDMCSFI